jgi:SAM-dependent methyltransferase
MRMLHQSQKYDCILNMFTSFGYFDTELENQQALASTAASLKEGGLLVLDFFNTQKVMNMLPQENSVFTKGTAFNIQKRYEDGFILKDISFVSEGKSYFFQEKVMAITQEMFEKYFESNGLQIIRLAGNYKIDAFDEESERMIFIAKKV